MCVCKHVCMCMKACVCMCVYACMCVCIFGIHTLCYKCMSVHVCATLHTHKARISDVFSSHPTLFPWDSLSENQKLTVSDRIASHGASRTSLSLLHSQPLPYDGINFFFYIGTGDLNSGPSACRLSTLSYWTTPPGLSICLLSSFREDSHSISRHTSEFLTLLVDMSHWPDLPERTTVWVDVSFWLGTLLS